MNRQETLDWIEDVMDAIDQSEVIEIIQETVASGDITPEFFETLDSETERLKSVGDTKTYDQLLEIARTVAIVKQNRKERL